MVELIEANITCTGEEGDRWYTAFFRWSSGTREQVVILERESPKYAARLQKALDATKDMSVTQRLAYYEQQNLAVNRD